MSTFAAFCLFIELAVGSMFLIFLRDNTTAVFVAGMAFGFSFVIILIEYLTKDERRA